MPSPDYPHIANINPIRYRGYYYDTETGLYYLQSRYYNPEWGRFINADDVDMLSFTGNQLSGVNLFAYCKNNSANYSDHTGYVVTPANVIGAVIGAIIGAVGGYFLTSYLADRLGLVGAKRKVFIAGLTAVLSASIAAIGYFVGPYVAKVSNSIICSLRRLFFPKIGTQVGRLGKIVKNTKPIIQGLTKHGSERLIQRGVTEALAQKIVNTGYAIAQSGGSTLYVSKAGVVVLTAAGKIITTHSAKYFDVAMQAIVKLLFG